MLKAKLTGVIPPMVTPLDDDEHVDRPAVARIVEHMLAGGVNGVFVLGTGGEGPALPMRDKATVIAETVRLINGRVPVLAGCSAVSTRQVLDEIAQAADLGADAAVVTPPYYFSWENQQVIASHYRALADESPLPIVAYNIPHMTHSPLTPETVAELAQLPRIVAIKDSHNDLQHFRRELALRPARADFSIFQGSEKIMLDSLLEGADGIVPGSANLAPRWAVTLFQAAKRGDVAAARAVFADMNAYREGCYSDGYWLSALKEGLHMLGLCGTRCMRPTPSVTEAHRARIVATLKRLGVL